jgi:hypothetical protein
MIRPIKPQRRSRCAIISTIPSDVFALPSTVGDTITAREPTCLDPIRAKKMSRSGLGGRHRPCVAMLARLNLPRRPAAKKACPRHQGHPELVGLPVAEAHRRGRALPSREARMWVKAEPHGQSPRVTTSAGGRGGEGGCLEVRGPLRSPRSRRRRGG